MLTKIAVSGEILVGQTLLSACFDVQHSIPAEVLRLSVQLAQDAYMAHTTPGQMQASCRRMSSFRDASGAAVIVGYNGDERTGRR